VEAYERLRRTILAYSPDADLDAVENAYKVAAEAHAAVGQRRLTGDVYFSHPLAVANILADIEADVPTIQAALLHDTVEDTDVTIEDIEARFGEEIARLVRGVTKLKHVDLDQIRPEPDAADDGDESRKKAEARRRNVSDTALQAENLRRFLLAQAEDLRVVTIKIADRLHNMQTIAVKDDESRRKTALETLQIFAPLAHRLGVWTLKWQLEDLAFKYLYPEQFAEIADKVARTRAEREDEIAEVTSILQSRLAAEGIPCQVSGRPKHLWSIYNKIRQQGLDFSDIYDLTAVRIIVETVPECYQALGIVHDTWTPIHGLFSDYIAMPKPNMYQSLHTKVLGPRGEPVEVQIRTFEMHRTAEFGVAAHWQYKEGGGKGRDSLLRKLDLMNRPLVQASNEVQSATEFIQNVVSVLVEDQVYVRTPKGDVIDLPAGSTPVDFAFRIHSRLGEHMVGARVNGRMAPLNTVLKNGDIVEVIQRSNATPSLDWLNFVKTSHAKTKIRQFFRRAHYSENVARGREALEREAQRLGLDKQGGIKPEALEKVATAMNYVNVDDLFAAIGNAQVAAQTVVNRLREDLPQPSSDRILTGHSQEARLDITAGGVDDVLITRARCCFPLPGEDVIGFVTQGRGVALHLRVCKNVAALDEASRQRLTEIEWRTGPSEKYPVPIRIEAFNRVGLLQDVSSVFSAANVNIREANVKQRPNHRAVIDIVPEVENVQALQTLLANVRKMSDVLEVFRVSTALTEEPDAPSPEQAAS
jgi:GTP pyrophosphokinase